MQNYNNTDTAVVLINLGTPDSAEVSDVKKYLDEFLMDPFVIDIPYWSRWLLVKGIILNTRPKKSAHAYKTIWTNRGSPLKFHLEDLAQKLKSHIQAPIYTAMRYGNPSFANLAKELEKNPNLKKLKILMLYPQWAWASSASTEYQLGIILGDKYTLEWINPFYNNPSFIESWAHRIKNTPLPATQTQEPHYLFSFHGIPERQLRYVKSCQTHCLVKSNCCEISTPEQKSRCYRAQCFETAKLIALKLKLKPTQYTVSFQSRLGRTPWLKPFTDMWIEEQSKAPNGHKNLVVVCPSFVSDCLETLEEIGIRAKSDFEKGDKTRSLTLVESLNSEPHWVESVAKIITGESTYGELSRTKLSLH